MFVQAIPERDFALSRQCRDCCRNTILPGLAHCHRKFAPRRPSRAFRYRHRPFPYSRRDPFAKLALMHTGAGPREIYANRLTELTRLLQLARRRRDRIGNIRLLVFLAAAAIVWYAFHGGSIWLIAAPLALFGFLV